MANWNDIKSQIIKLINDANNTTGKTDTNLTDSVNTLISGYGGSSNASTPLFYGVNGGIDVQSNPIIATVELSGSVFTQPNNSSPLMIPVTSYEEVTE